jgi:hypothetical protein
MSPRGLGQVRWRPPDRAGFALVLGVLLSACGDLAAPLPEGSGEPGVSLSVAGGAGQSITGGERSPAPFRVRALGADGLPRAGAEVAFAVEGSGGGILSQPRALTDAEGVAETFLLESRAGEGAVVARLGGARVELPFRVSRAPGRLVFEEGSGVTGLPLLPHPDSLITVTLFDTEGRPLAGWPVLFAAQGELASGIDTTDAVGQARTRLRRSGAESGEGAVFAFVLGFQKAFAATSRPVRSPAARVLLVSIEGLRGDALARYSPPHLVRLAQEGSWTDKAQSVLPTLTVPAHLSLLAGVPPEEHGIVQDRMELTQEMAKLEPLFRRARRRGRSGAAVLSREGPLAGFGEILECRQAFGLDRLTLVAPTSTAALAVGLQFLADPEVELLFVHLPDPDQAGHAHGWESDAYGEAVLRADAAVGALVAAARAPGAPPTLIVVTSPHGGGGSFGPFQHGSGSAADREVPIILNGPGIEGGSRLGSATLLDVAPTVLWGLGISPHPQYRGRILLEAADG